jgi:hypothetical protein
MSPVALSGTDTPLDTPNPDVNYTALRLAHAPGCDSGRAAQAEGDCAALTDACQGRSQLLAGAA